MNQLLNHLLCIFLGDIPSKILKKVLKIHPLPIGNTSRNDGCSIAMLVDQRELHTKLQREHLFRSYKLTVITAEQWQMQVKTVSKKWQHSGLNEQEHLPLRKGPGWFQLCHLAGQPIAATETPGITWIWGPLGVLRNPHSERKHPCVMIPYDIGYFESDRVVWR